MLNRLQNLDLPDEALAKKIVGLAMKVHRTLGCGFVESVYANALLVELRQAQIPYEREKVYSVLYEGVEVGVFHADLVIDNRLIVELKSVESLAIAHSVQLVITFLPPESSLACCLTLERKASNSKPKPVSTAEKMFLPISNLNPVNSVLIS